MHRMRKATLLSIPALLVALGCGGDKTEAPAPAPEAPAQAPEPPEPAPIPAPAPGAQALSEPAEPDAEGVVRLTANDQMRFSTTRIHVKSGEKVKVELKNVGTLPKDAMGHNLVVLKPGTEVTAFAAKAMSAKATGYIPADAQDQIIAHTKLLGPGESDTIEFEVPGPGTYAFLCSFPGHVALMNGQLVVE